MTFPAITEQQIAEMLASTRKQRDALLAFERALGFDWKAEWQPLSFESVHVITPGATALVSARMNTITTCYAGKPKALVVIGDYKDFKLLEVRIGKTTVLYSDAGLPAEQYAYDNPPRTVDFPPMHISQDVSFNVQNVGGGNRVFRATIWYEPIR